MSGNLAYELRGPIEEGPEIYDAVFKAGQDLGIQRLGWRTYLVNHVEGGFPQMTWTFWSSAYLDPGYTAFLEAIGFSAAVQGVGQRRSRRRPRASAQPDRARLGARGEVRPRLHRARGAGGRGRRPEADRRDAAVEPRGRRRHLRLAAAAGRGVQDDRPADVPAVERGHERPRRPRAEGRPADRRLLGHDLQLLLPAGHLARAHRHRSGRDRQRGRRAVGRPRQAHQGRARDRRALPLRQRGAQQRRRHRGRSALSRARASARRAPRGRSPRRGSRAAAGCGARWRAPCRGTPA